MAKAAPSEVVPDGPLPNTPVVLVPKVIEPPDPSKPIECTAILLDRPVGVNTTDPAIRVGAYVSNGIRIGGLCERIVLHPNGTYVVHVRKSVSSQTTEAEKARHPMQYLVFREGFGEVAT